MKYWIGLTAIMSAQGFFFFFFKVLVLASAVAQKSPEAVTIRQQGAHLALGSWFLNIISH